MNSYTSITTPADWLCRRCDRPRKDHSCLEGFEQERVPFVAMLRVRNEARFIAEVIESLIPLCGRIFMMDDHSTDDTVEVCKRYPTVEVYPSPFTGLNEARDKNWLYDQITRRVRADWIVCIDGDEVLEKNGPDIIRDVIGNTSVSQNRHSFKLKIEWMWNSRDTIRVDRVYGDFWRPSLFRPFYPDPDKPDDLKIAGELRFKATPFGRHVEGNEPNLHCSSVPQRYLNAPLLPARLKHLGYMWREDRVRKLDYYTSIDWKNQAEDCYRHMTQGDEVGLMELPKVQALAANGTLGLGDVEFLIQTPADMMLVHAGPLQIVPWNEDKSWTVTDWARATHK